VEEQVQPNGRAEAWLAGQNRALELIAGDAPLETILHYLVLFIESQAPGLYCSVLLLEGGLLRHGAAPSLPDAYNQAVEGLAIGPLVGSCGTSAYLGEAVIVSDIATDPLWADFKDLALQHGLRACWSTPIRSRTDEVLGTFAIYYREARAPDPDELRLVEVATHLAGIAIERHRTDLALKQRAEQLAEADRTKDDFIATLAHELRNPLASLFTALSLLRKRGSDPVAVERYRAMMDRQARYLNRLVDDLLDVSRIKAGKVTLARERVTLDALFSRALETVRPLIEQQRHEIRVVLPPEPLEIEADPIRIEQVLANLLGNSAKYTRPGGCIVLSAERQGAEIVIRVEDTGIGIAREMLPRIFEPFVQINRSARSGGGLGIGLTLVRNLVELHGGQVTAQSEGIGQGSTFIVRLPVAGAASRSGRLKAANG